MTKNCTFLCDKGLDHFSKNNLILHLKCLSIVSIINFGEIKPAVVGQALHPAVLDGVGVKELQFKLVIVEAFPLGHGQGSEVLLGRRVSGRDGNICFMAWPDKETVS